MNGPRYLLLVVDEFNSRVNRSSLARISLNRLQHPFGSIMCANNANGYLESEYRTYFGKNDIYKLNVRLEDEYGRIINLNGLDFSFQLRIEYE